MRAGAILAGFLAAVISMFGVVYLLRQDSSGGTTVAPVASSQSTGDTGDLEISKNPPWPKAVAEQIDFAFDRMEIGEERSAEFPIRNEGEAPLKLKEGMKTCQCTISEIEKGEVAPGSSAIVTLTWKPKEQSEMFEKIAEIKTNDPNNKTIRLRIFGSVMPRLAMDPDRNWYLREVKEDGPTEFEGRVMSPILEEFQILAIESGSPLMTAESVRLTADQMQGRPARSGYAIRVSVKPEMPVGPFTFPMAIKTDVSERNADGSISEKKIDFNVLVSGTRRGPIRINGGPEWVEEKSIASLGTFSAADGKKIKLQLLMKSVPEEGLKLTSVESDPATLKFSLTPVEKKTGVYHRFDLTVEFPAGGPRVTRRDPNPAKVRLGLNHPDASELTFNVYFTAY